MPIKIKRSRIWAYGSNTVISTVLFLGILVVVALTAERHPWRVDFSDSGNFSLTEQTKNILKSIDKIVEIKAFYATGAPEQARAKDLLDTYKYQSDGKINYEFIDPDRQPEAATNYGIRTYGTVVVEGYGKKQPLQNLTEESLSNALLKLTRNDQKKVYFLTGQGERSAQPGDKDGYSTVRAALQKENYATTDLSLLQQARVPEDASLVVVAGPKKPLMPAEIESLRSYLAGGGRLMALLDPYQDGGLRDFLKSYGIELNDDIVIDKLSRVFGGSYLMPVVMEYGRHKITDRFDVATFYPEARSILAAKEPPPGVAVEVLASTSQNAWAERDLESVKKGQVAFDEKIDLAGPVPLAVIAEIGKDRKETAAKPSEPDPGADEKDLTSRKGYLLVAGSSSFADDTYFGLSGNADLFLNMVHFMAGEENLITIKPREKQGQPLLLSQSQVNLVLWTSLIAMPLLVLLAGFTVYRIRRSQR